MPYIPDRLVHSDQWSALAYQEIINLKEIVMARIDRVEALIKAEVGEALATMQQRVDDALAKADASDAERAAVEAEFEEFQARVDNLGDRLEEEGLFGQDDDEDTEPEPGNGEPGNGEPTPEPEPPAGGQDDPGAVTF